MGVATLTLLVYIIIFILILLIISLLLRIRNLEKRLVNFSPTEAYTIMETMRDMVIESERVADNLDNSIKAREAALEDLSDIVDEKIARLERAIDGNGREKDISSAIKSLGVRGMSDSDIARELGISVTEVRIALNLAAGRKA